MATKLLEWIILPFAYLRGLLALGLLFMRTSILMRKYGHPINKTLLAGKPAFTSRLIKRLHMWTFDFAVIRDNPNFRLGVQAPNVKIFDYNTKSTTDLYSFLDSLPHEYTVLNFGSIT